MQTTPVNPQKPAPGHPAGAAPDTFPWTPDLGDGTYRNPIIHADYSDPDVIRVGADYYLVASSFNCTPGLPILHSQDLVNWTIIAHAVENLPHPRYARVQPGEGIWAPAIRFHAGKFWIFFPTPDEGLHVITADHPAGPWSAPHLLQAGKGLIDPCPLWDDDGQAWLVHAYAKSRAGIKHLLRVCPMSPDGSRLLGEGRIVFNDPARHPTLEGPKFLKKDGWYYILAPAGGVATGWQVALRSRNIYGPYEDRVVLEQGGTPVNGPHQGALVDTPEGAWWFIHFQDADAYGRILHLQPVTWQDGWPLMGRDQDGNGIGEPVAHFRKPVNRKNVPATTLQTSDEFDSPKLGLQWQWHANHESRWFSLAVRPGWLRLFPQPARLPNLAAAPNLLLQKLPAPAFQVTTRLDFGGLAVGERAGLVMMGADYSYLAFERTATDCRVIKVSCSNAPEGGTEVLEAETIVAGDFIFLRITVGPGAICEFGHGRDGVSFSPLGNVFTARAGKWIGAKVGLFCQLTAPASKPGHADFDCFRLG